MKRGEVYWADLVPRSGSEQTGRRPVIVMSHDGFNLAPTSICHRNSGFHLGSARAARSDGAEIPRAAGGLPTASWALCHQVTTLDRAKLTKRIGALPVPVVKEVESGLKAALDLD